MSIAAANVDLRHGPLPLEERARRRITRCLATFLFLLYVLNYMDRVNISYAALQMTGDLGFSNAVFGFGAGVARLCGVRQNPVACRRRSGGCYSR
jgi:hypothetical protein